MWLVKKIRLDIQSYKNDYNKIWATCYINKSSESINAFLEYKLAFIWLWKVSIHLPGTWGLGYWVILLKLHTGLKEFQLTLEVFHYYRELDFKVQLHLHFNFIHNEIYLWETFLSSFWSIRFLNLLTKLQRRNSFFFSIKIEDLWGRLCLCVKKVFCQKSVKRTILETWITG